MLFDVENKKIKPLYMWAGGKSKCIPFYAEMIDKHIRNKDTYIESFFGGGAMFCYIANNYPHIERFIINDINPEIMEIYQSIQRDYKAFIQDTKAYFKELECLCKESQKQRYYELRKLYWKNPTPELLYALMKYAFNGIWQMCKESNGLFATPYGLHSNKPRLDEENIKAWSSILQKTLIHSGDYKDIEIPKRSLVFLDPPYRDVFTTYGVEFDDDKQKELLTYAYANKEDNTILLANKDIGDGFFEEHTQYLEKISFDYKHTTGRVNSNNKKKEVTEILIRF